MGGEVGEAPGTVPWARLLGVDEEGRVPTGKLSDALANLWDFAYRIPQMLGYGDHWPLRKDEAKTLGVASDACLKTIPPKTRTKHFKTITKWLPWVSLTATAYILTMPRIMTTNLGMAQRRAAYGRATTAGSSTPAPAGSGGNGAPPDGAGDRLPTWEDFQRSRG